MFCLRRPGVGGHCSASRDLSVTFCVAHRLDTGLSISSVAGGGRFAQFASGIVARGLGLPVTSTRLAEQFGKDPFQTFTTKTHITFM